MLSQSSVVLRFEGLLILWGIIYLHCASTEQLGSLMCMWVWGGMDGQATVCLFFIHRREIERPIITHSVYPSSFTIFLIIL